MSHAAFRPCPLADQRPLGWLRRYLETQAAGLTGHIRRAGHPFTTLGWGAKTPLRIKRGGRWWPYEQIGYWVDGAITCGHLLDDQELIDQAGEQIERVLERADGDGYLGPPHLKRPQGLKRWPHAVFFRAMIAHHSATGDARIPKAIADHYLSGTCDHSRSREACNIEPMIWAYEQTGDQRLLDHALTAFAGTDEWFEPLGLTRAQLLSEEPGFTHGVSFCEMAKLGAILYQATGNHDFLEPALHAFHKLDRDQMLVDGIPSSSEHLRGHDPLDSHETCVIADYTWSIGHLLMITGDPSWGDRLERACFNAGPGAADNDFRSHQYFSCPNQVIADATSNHNAYNRGDRWMMYSAGQHTQCCTGNLHRIMPNYAARMWMQDHEGGLVAALHGPGRVQHQGLTLTAETQYPFGDRIAYLVEGDTSARFPLKLRIPGWCSDARLEINGQPHSETPSAGSWLVVDRTFSPGDRLTLHLPMPIGLSHWPEGGIALSRGPLVFALPIAEDWQEDPACRIQRGSWPAWRIHPDSPWNYALAIDEDRLDQIEVITEPASDTPFQAPPIRLRLPARRVEGWDLQHVSAFQRATSGETDNRDWSTIQAEATFTPPLPTEDELRQNLAANIETIELVPYGGTQLRLTIFPQAPPTARP